MSETLIGVVIGGLIVIAGSIVTGLFQKHQTRVTLKAQNEQQTRQFEFEKQQREREFQFEKEQKIREFDFNKEQQVISRAIDERKKWIEPLKISLSEYSKCADYTHNWLVALRVMDFAPNDLESLKESITNWDSATIKLCADTAQINDSTLKQSVENLYSDQTQVSIIGYQEIDLRTCLEYEERLVKIKESISQTFKRIEDLLCGR